MTMTPGPGNIARKIPPKKLPGWGELVLTDGSRHQAWFGRGGKHFADDFDAYLDERMQDPEFLAAAALDPNAPEPPAHRWGGCR